MTTLLVGILLSLAAGFLLLRITVFAFAKAYRFEERTDAAHAAHRAAISPKGALAKLRFTEPKACRFSQRPAFHDDEGDEAEYGDYASSDQNVPRNTLLVCAETADRMRVIQYRIGPYWITLYDDAEGKEMDLTLRNDTPIRVELEVGDVTTHVELDAATSFDRERSFAVTITEGEAPAVEEEALSARRPPAALSPEERDAVLGIVRWLRERATGTTA